MALLFVMTLEAPFRVQCTFQYFQMWKVMLYTNKMSPGHVNLD